MDLGDILREMDLGKTIFLATGALVYVRSVDQNRPCRKVECININSGCTKWVNPASVQAALGAIPWENLPCNYREKRRDAYWYLYKHPTKTVNKDVLLPGDRVMTERGWRGTYKGTILVSNSFIRYVVADDQGNDYDLAPDSLLQKV